MHTYESINIGRAIARQGPGKMFRFFSPRTKDLCNFASLLGFSLNDIAKSRDPANLNVA